ncbi:hypothetical protein OG785_36110 [Streptomyces sp. NBC_00006]|uniref:hypothetical protein n=1 Tax=unclassified Streptomyces TaxID=2593676 RepID=UPI00225C1826|nr:MULTISPECIES: hypothetical protein [unclassified Streptomyces]MCX4831441.1 hypothetical protein [Streptomyces sp. NBC_01016]MCX5535965.1 hypothetical protein [Streptomyces sp. NBC_00006]
MSHALHDEPLAELSAPYWIDSPLLQHGLGSCSCVHTPTPAPAHLSATLRLIAAGLVSGLLVVVLAVAVMG